MYKHQVIILMKEIIFLDEKYDFYEKQFSECFHESISKHLNEKNKNIDQNNIFSKNNLEIVKRKKDVLNNYDLKLNEEIKNDEDINKYDTDNNLNNFKTYMKKKIAFKTHPDLFGDEKVDCFLKSQEYYESDNIFGLLNLCYNLNIDISKYISKNIYNIILIENKKKKERLNGLIPWIWFENLKARPQIRSIISKQWNVTIDQLIKEEDTFTKL